MKKIQIFKRFDCGESLEYFSHLQRFGHSKDSNLGNLSNIFSHLEKIHTFKKFCSGEYLSHLQKIQLFGRFNCGESLEYFSHLLNISHICKDSDIQKIPLPENAILSLGQNLNIIFSTSLHFTSPPLSASLHATSCHYTSPPILSGSLRDAFCYFCLTSPKFTPLHLSSDFVRLTSPHFTSPPILFASLHLTSCHFALPPLSFPRITSGHFTSPPLCLPHFTPLCATSPHLCYLRNTSPHFMPLHFTSHSFCITSLHFVPLCFASPPFHLTSHQFTPPPLFLSHFTSLYTTLHLPFCLPHFMSLHVTSLCLPFCLGHFAPPSVIFATLTLRHFTSHFVHLTSCHFALPLVLFASLHLTSSHFTLTPIPSCITSPYFVTLCFTSPPFSLPHFTPLHFTPTSPLCPTILLTLLFLQKIQIFERFNSGESLK